MPSFYPANLQHITGGGGTTQWSGMHKNTAQPVQPTKLLHCMTGRFAPSTSAMAMYRTCSTRRALLPPEFVMATLGEAWLLVFARDPSFSPHAKTILETAATMSMNEREQGHLAALQQAVTGALGASVTVLDRHLMRYPLDILAHEISVFFDHGRSRWIQDRAARALPLWPKDAPGYDALLTVHGFGLEETGDYARAEKESRAALEVEPNNLFAHHTVAHVMEMTGRPEDGLGWMSAREPFWTQQDHFLRGHIWWHKALYHLELVPRVVHSAGYNRFSFTRASAVVNCQSALTCLRFRVCSQAATSSMRLSLSGIRRSRH